MIQEDTEEYFEELNEVHLKMDEVLEQLNQD